MDLQFANSRSLSGAHGTQEQAQTGEQLHWGNTETQEA